MENDGGFLIKDNKLIHVHVHVNLNSKIKFPSARIEN